MGASLPLKITLGLVMLASALELSLISATVAYLAQLDKRTFTVSSSTTSSPSPPTTTTTIHGLPATLLVDQGHTANGAAGTALVLLGLGGVLALHLRSRARYHHATGARGALARAVYRLWLGLTVPALLLTLGALAYVLAVTRMHDDDAGQMAALLDHDHDNGNGGVVAVLGTWTPQGWLGALARLDVADRAALRVQARVARAWEWNLVPFFGVQVGMTVCAWLDARRRRGERGVYEAAGGDREGGYGYRYGEK